MGGSVFSIYIESPVPNLVDIKEDFLNQLSQVQSQIPDFQEFIDTLSDIPLPNLMGLPTPIFQGYSNIPQELMEVVDAIKYQVDTITMMSVFKPLSLVIGGSLEDILPKIPALDVSILDIVNGDIQNLHSAVSKALEDGIKLPFVPSEIFESYSNFEKESLLAIKMVLVGYKELLLNTMQSMTSSAMSILKISGVLPVLPTIPSIEQLKETALSAFPEYKEWSALITDIGAESIINSFGLGMFVMPENLLIPNYSNYEQYLMESLNQIKDYYTSLGLKTMVDFVEKTLGMLNFSFPPIRIGF